MAKNKPQSKDLPLAGPIWKLPGGKRLEVSGVLFEAGTWDEEYDSSM